MIILNVEEHKKTVFELNEIEPFEEEITFIMMRVVIAESFILQTQDSMILMQ